MGRPPRPGARLPRRWVREESAGPGERACVVLRGLASPALPGTLAEPRAGQWRRMDWRATGCLRPATARKSMAQSALKGLRDELALLTWRVPRLAACAVPGVHGGAAVIQGGWAHLACDGGQQGRRRFTYHMPKALSLFEKGPSALVAGGGFEPPASAVQAEPTSAMGPPWTPPHDVEPQTELQPDRG
jgi:hypothetical protein